MTAQQVISRKLLARKVGRRLPVIIDDASGPVARGRSRYEAPEIDGTVHVSSRRPLRQGDVVTCRIDRTDDYDLHGSVV